MLGSPRNRGFVRIAVQRVLPNPPQSGEFVAKLVARLNGLRDQGRRSGFCRSARRAAVSSRTWLWERPSLSNHGRVHRGSWRVCVGSNVCAGLRFGPYTGGSNRRRRIRLQEVLAHVTGPQHSTRPDHPRAAVRRDSCSLGKLFIHQVNEERRCRRLQNFSYRRVGKCRFRPGCVIGGALTRVAK